MLFLERIEARPTVSNPVTFHLILRMRADKDEVRKTNNKLRCPDYRPPHDDLS
jgi:hypothetical protein